MMNDGKSRLLMSDDIKGMVPELEEDKISAFSDSFVVAALDMSDGTEQFIVAGSLTGLSIESLGLIKIDIKTALRDAYTVIKKYKVTGLSARVFFLHLDDDEVYFEGPYSVTCPKLLEFDHQNKMCVLGIDLIKI